MEKMQTSASTEVPVQDEEITYGRHEIAHGRHSQGRAYGRHSQDVMNPDHDVNAILARLDAEDRAAGKARTVTPEANTSIDLDEDTSHVLQPKSRRFLAGMRRNKDTGPSTGLDDESTRPDKRHGRLRRLGVSALAVLSFSVLATGNGVNNATDASADSGNVPATEQLNAQDELFKCTPETYGKLFGNREQADNFANAFNLVNTDKSKKEALDNLKDVVSCNSALAGVIFAEIGLNGGPKAGASEQDIRDYGTYLYKNPAAAKEAMKDATEKFTKAKNIEVDKHTGYYETWQIDHKSNVVSRTGIIHGDSTILRVTFEDNTVLEFRADCGWQPFKKAAKPVFTPAKVTIAPAPVRYVVPTPEVVVDQPEIVVVPCPPEEQPPVYEPPVYEPPVYEPPVYEPPVYEPPVYEPPEVKGDNGPDNSYRAPRDAGEYMVTPAPVETTTFTQGSNGWEVTDNTTVDQGSVTGGQDYEQHNNGSTRSETPLNTGSNPNTGSGIGGGNGDNGLGGDTSGVDPGFNR